MTKITIWNYAKKKNIELEISECPNCGNEAEVKREPNTYIKCAKCGLRTRNFFTDTGMDSRMEEEKAVKVWNEGSELFFDNDPETIFVKANEKRIERE